MPSCVFCEIVAGQVESSKVYEDEELLVFMDIQPVRQGQVLVIPKQHIDHFSDIPEALALKIYTKAHALLKAMREILRPDRMGLVVHGYGVPHAHVVIVPQHHEDDITSARMANIENGRVIFTTKKLPLIPREELDQMAQLIKKSPLFQSKQKIIAVSRRQSFLSGCVIMPSLPNFPVGVAT